MECNISLERNEKNGGIEYILQLPSTSEDVNNERKQIMPLLEEIAIEHSRSGKEFSIIVEPKERTNDVRIDAEDLCYEVRREVDAREDPKVANRLFPEVFVLKKSALIIGALSGLAFGFHNFSAAGEQSAEYIHNLSESLAPVGYAAKAFFTMGGSALSAVIAGIAGSSLGKSICQPYVWLCTPHAKHIEGYERVVRELT